MARKRGVIRTQLFGMSMRQKPAEFWLYEGILNACKRDIGWIVEIGTANGALSMYFNLWAQLNGMVFHTFDMKKPRSPEVGAFLARDHVFNEVDVFSETGRGAMTHACHPGPGFLLCDGPDKAREIATFTPALELGSVIVGHDYRRQWTAEVVVNGGMALFDVDFDTRGKTWKYTVPDLEFLQPWHDKAREKGARMAVFRKK